jgi:hypothetical protein
LLSFLFVLLPQAVALTAWFFASSNVVRQIELTGHLPPIDQFMSLFTLIGESVLFPSMLATLLFIVGVLSLARTSVDYFESKPESIKSTILRSVRVLLFKGLGVMLMLLILLPALSVMPILRAIGMSMLVMLPITLVAGTAGGFKTTWDTLWLKYTSPTSLGRWPVFVNVLSITGTVISLFFIGGILIEAIPVLDIKFGLSSALFEKDVFFFGRKMNLMWFVASTVGLIWETGLIAVIMPFLASLHHLTTAPDGHTPFQAEL